MSDNALRRADARLLLPLGTGRRVALRVPDEGWAPALERDGRMLGAEETSADLLITSPQALEHLAEATQVVVVEGPVRRVPTGWSARRYLAVVRRDEPVALVPRGAPDLVVRATEQWQASRPATRALRRVLRQVPRAAPLLLPAVTVLTREPREPGFLELARQLGGQDLRRGYLLTGGGSERRRVAAVLFGPDGTRPRAVLKINRYPGADADARVLTESAGLRTAATVSTGQVRVPALLGTGHLDGRAASLEVAAEGTLLRQVAVDDPAAARRALATVTEWLDHVAVSTANGGPDRPTLGEVVRQRREALAPHWPGAQPLLDQAAQLVVAGRTPTVLAHQDLLDGGNVLVAADASAAVIDWETADLHGLPLTDLLPFLSRLLAVLTVGRDEAATVASVLTTARGDSAQSDLLFRAVAHHAGLLGLSLDVVGPLAVLAWAHHGAAIGLHNDLLRADGLPAVDDRSWARTVGLAWMRDPGLGLHWPALSAWAGPTRPR